MFRYSILCLMLAVVSTTVQADPENIDEVLKLIFGDCDMDDGGFGICVKYYLCNKNETIIDDGSNILTERVAESQRKCQSDLEVCCRTTDTLEKDPEQNMVGQGCGFRNPEGLGLSKSYDENSSKPGEFPWTVVIITKVQVDTSPQNLYLGGGSLIHPSVVLTVAHVIKDDELIIRAGEWDTKSTSELYTHQDRNVKEIVKHEKYTRPNLFNNIALLFLDTPVVLTPNVGVICLPKQHDITSGGEMCFSTGWGKDITNKKRHTIMKKMEVPAVNRNECQSKLRTTRLSQYFKLHKSFICAGGNKESDMCQGDGGSPLVCPIANQKNRYIQKGIVSWGIGCGQDGIPGVYTNVALFRTWIEEKLSDRGYDISVLNY